MNSEFSHIENVLLKFMNKKLKENAVGQENKLIHALSLLLAFQLEVPSSSFPKVIFP